MCIDVHQYTGTIYACVMHACIHTYVRTYVRTYIHTYIHAQVHLCTQTVAMFCFERLSILNLRVVGVIPKVGSYDSDYCRRLSTKYVAFT